jgi:hypothetical protein
MLAARNLDWKTFYGRQTRRGRRLLAVVAEGSSLQHGARLLGLSDSGIQSEKKKLASALVEFMGVNILADVNRQGEEVSESRQARQRIDQRQRLVAAEGGNPPPETSLLQRFRKSGIESQVVNKFSKCGAQLYLRWIQLVGH